MANKETEKSRTIAPHSSEQSTERRGLLKTKLADTVAVLKLQATARAMGILR